MTGVLFQVEDQAVILNGLSCPHDPQFLDGGWVVCNSRQCELLHIDEHTGQRLHNVHLGGWTRGLCVGTTSIYVGISRQRYAEGETETSEVAVLDRTTWNVVNRIALPCREITTLSLVSRKFLRGLRTGFQCNASRALAQDQADLFRAFGDMGQKSYTPMKPQAARATPLPNCGGPAGSGGRRQVHRCDVKGHQPKCGEPFDCAAKPGSCGLQMVGSPDWAHWFRSCRTVVLGCPVRWRPARVSAGASRSPRPGRRADTNFPSVSFRNRSRGSMWSTRNGYRGGIEVLETGVQEPAEEAPGAIR